MEKVRSKDGVAIAFQRSGRGPPVVLVHGTTADHTRWAPILPGLGRHFTVLAIDRRGRGQSGDSEPYELAREFDDVAAVVAAAGPGPSLVGHSYGALCALEAALRVDDLARLVLYEPAFPVGGEPLYPPGARAKFEALLAEGDRDRVLADFFRDVVAMSDDDIAVMRAEASWAGRIAAAHTLVREMADGEYRFDPARFRGLAVPTLLVTGERSPRILTAPSDQLALALPDVRRAVLPGQTHGAISLAPDLFLREVLAFLTT